MRETQDASILRKQLREREKEVITKAAITRRLSKKDVLNGRKG